MERKMMLTIKRLVDRNIRILVVGNDSRREVPPRS